MTNDIRYLICVLFSPKPGLSVTRLVLRCPVFLLMFGQVLYFVQFTIGDCLAWGCLSTYIFFFCS